MGGPESVNNIPNEQPLNTITSIRSEIDNAIQDSRLTPEEAGNINYSLDSAIDGIQRDVHYELQDAMKETVVSGIDLEKGSAAERRIGNYLGIDLPAYVNFLEQDGYTIPNNYSIRDNGTYLVFHDENGEDIATINWETHETGGGGFFIKDDDRTDNLNGADLADSYDINREWMIDENMQEIQSMRERLFDANIIFEDPFNEASTNLAAESFGLSETGFKNMMVTFQQQVVLDGHSPRQEDLWKNIGIIERGGNELWFNQQTPDGSYVGIYDRDGNFKSGGIWS